MNIRACFTFIGKVFYKVDQTSKRSTTALCVLYVLYHLIERSLLQCRLFLRRRGSCILFIEYFFSVPNIAMISNTIFILLFHIVPILNCMSLFSEFFMYFSIKFASNLLQAFDSTDRSLSNNLPT